MEEAKDNRQHEAIAVLPRPLQWMIASIVGLGSGLTGAATNIQAEFRSKLLSHPEIKRMETEHADKLEALTNDRIANKISKQEWVRNTASQKDSWTQELNDFAKRNLEVGDNIVTGTIDRFRTFGRDTRNPIIFGTITATVIGSAATMMLFNSMHTHERLEEINENTKQR